MVQKAQVFPLETNTSVRSRLTHTLEVADIGRTLSRRIGRKLVEDERLEESDALCLEVIVGNACLLHDIGNPPFGHFGETAIRDWFNNEIERKNLPLTQAVTHDLRHFDGNPQGLRVALTLHNENNDTYGLNLTAATILASVKYPMRRGAKAGAVEDGRKLGVFSTEEDRWLAACDLAEHDASKRYWLAYVMEAADDICYCTSDISDAIDKGIVSLFDLKEFLGSAPGCHEVVEQITSLSNDSNFGMKVAVPLSQRAISEVASKFTENVDGFVDSGSDASLLKSTSVGCVYDSLRDFAKARIYCNQDVQKVEIAGYHIIHGLLERMSCLADLSQSEFSNFMAGGSGRPKGRHDLHWRVFCQCGERVKKGYRYALESNEGMSAEEELLLRYRLIVDFVSALTDRYALTLHQTFTGSSL